jgi:hypothetical protein
MTTDKKKEKREAGYYWAFHLDGFGDRLADDPEIIQITTRGAVQLFGDDYDYDQDYFLIIGSIVFN